VHGAGVTYCGLGLGVRMTLSSFVFSPLTLRSSASRACTRCRSVLMANWYAQATGVEECITDM
jgi:hypothetical protein